MYAVGQWNLVLNTGWPNILICEQEEKGCSERNDDNSGVVIRTVDGYGSDPCRPRPAAVACVEYHPSFADEYFRFIHHPEYNLQNMTMRLEEPAHGANSNGHETRLYWVDDVDLDGAIVEGRRGLRHLKTLVMHEFGHTLGLTDLYGRTIQYPGYLMDNKVTTTIPLKDINYVKQLYRNKFGGVRH